MHSRMAVCPACVLLFAVLLFGVEGHQDVRGRKEVSGSSTVYLGQHRDIWRPLIHTTVNISEISSISSFFQFRTFDPEGTIFYGDTKQGQDWFVLSLKDGIPLMQISKEDMLVSVAGGPKLNDGKWHKLEVSNQGKFVILKVDGAPGLSVGMQSKQTEEVISGELRLALGGVLMDRERLVVQFEPQMDGCVREGSWLNLSVPWEAEVEELWPCYQNVRPGSYFPGTGFAIFNISVQADQELVVELWGDFNNMVGTICSFKAAGQDLIFAIVAKNSTKVVLIFDEDEFILHDNLKKLKITFYENSFSIVHGEEPVDFDWIGDGQTTKRGHFAFGGLLGEADNIGSQFLTGCLEKIQVDGKDLDLDLIFRDVSISTHSCPA